MKTISIRGAAITAGISILVMTAAAVVSNDLTIGRLVIPGDALATTENILAFEGTFRLGIFSWIVVLLCDLLAAWGLYQYFRPVNSGISLMMAWSRLAYIAMLGAAIFHFIHVLVIIGSESYVEAFGTGQLQAQIHLYTEAFEKTWSAALIVFGLHILLLAWLILRSSYVPVFFAIWLLAGGCGYFIVHSSKLLFPVYGDFIRMAEWIFLLPMLGEVALGVWLVWKGKNVVLREHGPEPS